MFDPFPARLTITVDGQVLESQGFLAEPRFFERANVDAWNALKSLEGRWISPDLVTALAWVPLITTSQPGSKLSFMM